MTLVATLQATAVVAPLAFEEATDGAAFGTYVEQVLLPALQPEDVVAWDNLKPLKNPQVKRAIEAVGARVEPLPVYSPDLTPIEDMFSKAKEHLRAVGARTTRTATSALGKALQRIILSDRTGWFQDRCAYDMHWQTALGL